MSLRSVSRCGRTIRTRSCLHSCRIPSLMRCTTPTPTCTPIPTPTPITSSHHIRTFASTPVIATPAPIADTPEEREMRDMVARWAQTHLQPHVKQMDIDGQLHPEVLSSLFQHGLMGIETPAEYQGTGATFVQSCIVIEELAKVDPAISVIVDIQNTLINTSIMKYGSDELKQKYLPMLATNSLGSFCLSEASSGSDAFAMKTTATQKNGKWVINGTKMWISNAAEAGLFVIFANADPSKGYKGITAFIVEKGTPGLTVGKKEDKMGIRASSTCELILDNVEVSSANVLGSIGSGYKIAIGSLNEGRIGIGAQMLGLAQGVFAASMPYIHQRKQFGQVIANFQGMQFSVAQTAVNIESARLLVYNAARLREAGHDFIKEAAMAKLHASQVAEATASKAIEWLGGIGFTKEMPIEKFYRDSKIGQIYEGTSNLQLQTIAKLISKEYTS